MYQDDQTPAFRLSKSKIAAFEHCPKRLWLQVHRRDAARIDRDTQALFAFGHAVGAKALLSFPRGGLVETGRDMTAALEWTAALMSMRARRPIFEATFQHQDVLVRVDILLPVGAFDWHAIEVKASTSLKPYQLADLATQVWTMRGCGVSIAKASLRLIGKPFSWRRPDLALVRFHDIDVTRAVERLAAKRTMVVQAARETVRGPEIEREMGPHCERPLSCEFRQHCRDLRDQPLLARLGTGPVPRQASDG